jgi:hypothetical protein
MRQLLPKSHWVDRITWKFGGAVFDFWVLNALPQILKKNNFDVCYVDGGEWATPKVLKIIKRNVKTIVNYNIDDPLGQRDSARSKVYRASLPYYDLVVVMRPENISEALERGARNVIRVYRSADEISHAPRKITQDDYKKWGADVLFLGTWMPERGPFLMDLIRKGVPLTIQGPQWHKAPEWKALRPFWRGGMLHGDDYAKAIQCAKVNLGLLSKGNRDLHTTRSLEIPALGGLLCAERTSEHVSMYEEGEEALFWSTAEECAANCMSALGNENARLLIAQAGRKRLAKNGNYNEAVLNSILAHIYKSHDDKF